MNKHQQNRDKMKRNSFTKVKVLPVMLVFCVETAPTFTHFLPTFYPQSGCFF